jgi:hypothetical protein
MQVVREWLEGSGYQVKDVSSTSPFDFEATKPDGLLKVEVKGTTCCDVDSIFMTRNEVELHRSEKGQTALMIVSSITVVKADDGIRAVGGKLETLVGWDIDQWNAVPVAYQLTKH